MVATYKHLDENQIYLNLGILILIRNLSLNYFMVLVVARQMIFCSLNPSYEYVLQFIFILHTCKLLALEKSIVK